MNYGMVPPPEHVHTRPHGDTTEKEKRYNELTRGYTTTRSSTWLRSEPLSRMTRELDILEIQNVINFDIAREYKMEREQQLQGQPIAGGAVGFGSGARQRTGLGYTAAPTMMMGQGSGTVAPGITTMAKASVTNPLGQSSGPFSQQATITKQIDRAKSLVATGNVKGMDRVSMMRSALKSTFKHSFQAATVTGSDYSLPASDPRPEWKIKLDEQAEKINQCINRQKQQGEEGDGEGKVPPNSEPTKADDGQQPKRRSRWT